jgi:prophage antirepressor-like protein
MLPENQIQTVKDSLQVFEFGSHQVRTAGTHDAPLFCAADVCAALGIVDAQQACGRLDSDDTEIIQHQKGHKRVSYGGPNPTVYVTESGLFSLILGSNKPEAKAFKKWVTSEVLPSIRKHGRYSLAEEIGRQQTERLLAECFPKLPTKAEPIFRELIAALLKLRRQGSAPGNPPWARSLASAVYGWAIRVPEQQQRRRSLNPNPGGNSTDHSMFGGVADDAVRRVVQTGTDMAASSVSWGDWRMRMELAFGSKALQMTLMVPMLHDGQQAAGK